MKISLIPMNLNHLKVVTSVKVEDKREKFTPASGRVNNYRIEYRNDDSDEWESVMTDGKTEYVIDGTKQIRVSSVLGKNIYGLVTRMLSRNTKLSMAL